MAQQQYYLDPSAHEAVMSIVKSGIVLPLETEPRVSRTISNYRALLAEQGLRAIAVDLTPLDIDQCGIKVVRVIVPGTVMNSPAAFPHLGNDVVRRTAEEFSSMWSAAKRWEKRHRISTEGCKPETTDRRASCRERV